MLVNFSKQWLVVNYTLPRDDKASQPKGWIQGNMRIGLALEDTTSFQHFKYGIEIRIKSVNQDDSHSWVRISYGTVKYVTDSIEDNTENPTNPQEEESPQTNTSVVAARSIHARSRCVRSHVTSRRRWSNSILQNQIPSTRLSSSNTELI